MRTQLLVAIHWSFRKSLAFIRRDFLFETTYKLQSLFKVMSVLFTLLTFSFLARLVGGEQSQAHLARYGGDYFTFLLVGISFMGMFNAGIIAFTTAIRQQINMGVLEAMAATPVRSPSLLFYSLLWPMGFEISKAIAYILLGMWFFGAQIAMRRPELFMLTLVLCYIIFGGLGAIGGGLIIYLKRGDPIAWLFSAFSTLAGGVLFPTTLLPDWMQPLAKLIPVTYALDALRGNLIPSADITDIDRSVRVLIVFAMVIAPLTWWSTRLTVERARAEGSLGLY